MQLSSLPQPISTNSSLEDISLTPDISTETDRATSLAAADFQSFLQLLTAQISNQDPLSPLESTQFVEQLASFSGLEQQIATNERLDTLLTQISNSGFNGSNDIVALGQLIGKFVATSQTEQPFDGEPIRFSIPDTLNTQLAPSAAYEIRDQNGTIVHSAPHDGRTLFEWNGQDNNGNQAAPGAYSLVITQPNSAGDNTVVARGMALSEVRQVHFQNDQPQLILGNGASISSGQIEGIVSRDTINAP